LVVEPARFCITEFRKYADTVAVSAGISHLFDTSPSLGRFVGIEHRLVANPNALLTPDITTLYNDDSKGLIFDLKYSLPSDVQAVKDELLSLEKYKYARSGWGVSGIVDTLDFVLVCHMDDAKRATEASRQIYKETGKSFFSPETFSIWSWTIGVSRSDERKEEMRLMHMYGATRNAKLQAMISDPGGILVAEEVLTTLRFTQTFVRQKPPVQYTMSLLIQNVLSALPPLPLSLTSQRQEYIVTLDTVSQKTNILFPPWWESDVQTVQVKRSWTKEAMDALAKVKLVGAVEGKSESYAISPRKIRSRKQLPQVICERLVALAKRRPRGRPRGQKKIETDKNTQSKRLTDYI
jgi:hypothetical protein